MEQATGNQQPSEQEQIAALAKQMEEMRQHMLRLEGQAEAIRLGIARALLVAGEDRKTLKVAGMLTRNAQAYATSGVRGLLGEFGRDEKEKKRKTK